MFGALADPAAATNRTDRLDRSAAMCEAADM